VLNSGEELVIPFGTEQEEVESLISENFFSI
jgi:hypothetical protein